MSQDPFNPYSAPQQPHAPPPQQYPYSHPRTSTMAVLSLVFSVVGFMVCILGVIPGIILGHLALGEIRQDPAVAGRGLAVAGLVIGYGLIVLVLIVILILVAIGVSPLRCILQSRLMSIPSRRPIRLTSTDP